VVKTSKRKNDKPNELLYRDKSNFIPEISCEELEAKLLNYSTCQPTLQPKINGAPPPPPLPSQGKKPLKKFTRKQRKLHSKLQKAFLPQSKTKRSMFKPQSKQKTKFVTYEVR